MSDLILLPTPKIVEHINCQAVKTDIFPSVEYVSGFDDEEYDILINTDGVFVKCKGELGKYRAKSTLAQIDAQSDKISGGLHIHDKPDFAHRGIMLDISRSKVPTLETLYKVVDILSAIKINELQLYVEGFSFAYESFPQVWQDRTPITGEEIKLLDKYCKDRFIELIPNQNCFGHMGHWLEREEFRHLAECPEGFQLDRWDYLGPHCLDPQNPETFEFVKKLFDDILPNFSSKIVNINCDETHELGKGKNRELCENIGKHRVYLDFLLKVIDYVKKDKEKVMFWGDIVLRAPDELLREIPKNVIAVNWGYNDKTPSEESCQKFEQAGVTYYNAPGTSSWNTILGNTDQYMNNIDNAVYRGLAHGASGILTTDWGDLNHLQYLPFSYPGFVYSAAKSWNVAENVREEIAPYLNKFVFKDKSNTFAQLMLRAGRYHSVADFSKTLRGLIIGILYYPLEGEKWAPLGEGFEKSEIKKLTNELSSIKCELDNIFPECEDAKLLRDEFYNAIRIMEYTCSCALYKSGNYIGNKQEHIEYLRELQNVFLPEHERVWLARNRKGGLEESVRRMKKVDMPLSEFGKFYPFSKDFD